MSGSVRTLVAEKLFKGFVKAGIADATQSNSLMRQIKWGLRVPVVSKQSRPDAVPICLLNSILHSSTRTSHARDIGDDVIKAIATGDELLKCQPSKKQLTAYVSSSWFAQNVLEEIVSQKDIYGTRSILHHYTSKHDTLIAVKQDQDVLVEFSSPNIAKPFHAGHLRSTVLGNFITRLYRALGHHVSSINFLGDWGTQFGYLGVGFAKFGSSIKLVESPMHHLFEVYVKANKEAEKNEEFHKEAKKFFSDMESGDELALDFWEECRVLSIEEYKETYKRLGVTFDEYSGESEYQTRASEAVAVMQQQGLAHRTEAGVVEVDLSEEAGRDLKATLIKSDGSTLYLTRDIAAFADRKDKYDFDRMFYVVDESQYGHFEQLIMTMRKLNVIPRESAYRGVKDYHVAYGRVKGMSTRKGEVVFLTDILDEARDRMKTVMQETETTKVAEDLLEDTADRLAVSALIIQNLSMSRAKGYTFSWDHVLQFTGNTGPYLQYQHARLTSLVQACEETLGLTPDVNVDYTLLVKDPEAVNVVMTMARFDEAIMKAFEDLGPQHITSYLFDLCNVTSKAFKTLNVRNQPTDVAKARLLLFSCARQTLRNGLRILGVEPLDKM